MREFAVYERLQEFFDATEERLFEGMFGEAAFVDGLIALDGEKPAGYAIFYPNFLTFRGQRGLFLEDLFVSEEYRSSGVGRALLSRVARIAADRGLERIDFLVLDWNSAAIRFYEDLGARRSEGETHFKFTDQSFRNLANG
jgi:ribosomal protein S18 acetylase RimI-like enzyme